MEKYVGKYVYVSSKGFGRAEFIFKLDEINDGCLCSYDIYIKSPIITGFYVGDNVSKNIDIKSIKTIREATSEEIELLKH